jgi:DNA-binding response OmpR family regulator
MHRSRILVVDDNPDVLTLIRSLLGKTYEARGARDQREALYVLETSLIELIVLDLDLGGGDGVAICQRIREKSNVPILGLSGHVGGANKIRALELGVDDYVTKPFSRDEFVARIRALLRRGRPSQAAESALQYDRLRIDFVRHAALVDGTTVPLTPDDYGLVEQLAINFGELLSRCLLAADQLGFEDQKALDNLLDLLRHVRHQIEGSHS